MVMNDDFELSAEEKLAFDNLPREQSPSKSLEERIVRALKNDGTLRSAALSSGASAFLKRDKSPGAAFKCGLWRLHR